ncbi:MAG TPA: hypothetical protein VFT34_02895 [Verrucomicrobiae bacterium]|nr:hypothetical protein [Verrucomicrobiae bacterium]
MTSTGAMDHWLRKRFAQEAGLSVFMGVAAIALGVVAVFLTFWLAYAMMWLLGEALSAVTQIVANKKLPWPHWLRLMGAAGFIVLLFRQHLRTSPWDRGSYADADATPTDGFDELGGLIAMHGGFLLSLGQLLRYPMASSRMIVEILETGPRLLTGAKALFRQADALRRMDTAGCAWVLTALVARTGSVPREELMAAWPDADWPRLWTQLRLIDGLVFLEKGISLTEDLRNELQPLFVGGRNKT